MHHCPNSLPVWPRAGKVVDMNTLAYERFFADVVAIVHENPV